MSLPFLGLGIEITRTGNKTSVVYMVRVWPWAKSELSAFTVPNRNCGWFYFYSCIASVGKIPCLISAILRKTDCMFL